MFDVTPELIAEMAANGHVTAAFELAEQHAIPLPEPFTFDCSLEEFRARMPELEQRLLGK